MFKFILGMVVGAAIANPTSRAKLVDIIRDIDANDFDVRETASEISQGFRDFRRGRD